MTPYFAATAVDFSDRRSVADSIEIQLLASGDPYLSYSEFRNLFPAGAEPASAQIELGFAEIGERRTLMGSHYPFSIEDQGARIDSSVRHELYSLLLILSLRGTPFRHGKEWRTSDPLFDAVVEYALRAKYDHALRFAWPPFEDRPNTFPEALAWAAGQMGLEIATHRQFPTHRADGGVDIIAWNPYGDGATGFPILLVQNTIAMDYSGKPADIDALLWREWISSGSTPATGFAVPFVVAPDDPVRPEVVSRVQDLLDRTRLMERLGGQDPTKWDEWEKLCDFVAAQLVQICQEVDGTGTSSVGPATRRKKMPRPPRER